MIIPEVEEKRHQIWRDPWELRTPMLDWKRILLLKHFQDSFLRLLLLSAYTTMLSRWSLCLSLLVVAVCAYQPPKLPARAKVASAAATAALSVLLSSAAPAFASSAAAQISLNQIPPTSISVEVGDLPIVGKIFSGEWWESEVSLLSRLVFLGSFSWFFLFHHNFVHGHHLRVGTYMKVADGTFKGTPSVTIKSPSDKVKAIKSLATGGHLEFDVSGKVKTHLDVDVAADEPGVARVRVASNLIPSLPFKNLASAQSSPTGGQESQWNIVTNMGNGESYYYNVKSGVTQFARPDKFWAADQSCSYLLDFVTEGPGLPYTGRVIYHWASITPTVL
jgi:hypothetical protein